MAATSGGIDMIVCPFIDCRNIDRHSGSVVVDHLVTRGMEEAYKMRSDWYRHGDFNSGVADEGRVHQWNDEIFGLYELLMVRGICLRWQRETTRKKMSSWLS